MPPGGRRSGGPVSPLGRAGRDASPLWACQWEPQRPGVRPGLAWGLEAATLKNAQASAVSFVTFARCGAGCVGRRPSSCLSAFPVGPPCRTARQAELWDWGQG